MEYLVRFAQTHQSFRQAELEALAIHANVKIEILSYSADCPFCVIRFADAPEHIVTSVARNFISRSILARGIYELWGQGLSYEELHAETTARTASLWARYNNVSFKFSVDAFCGKRSMGEQRDIINSFAYLGFSGRISMSSPDEEFVVFEEWEPPNAEEQTSLLELNKSAREGFRSHNKCPRRVFLGRFIGGTRRYLAEKHDLKKRPYISTTSMDAELALVTANLALAGPGKIFLDPFVGTGGFLIAAAEQGALVLGSDIDGRSFRGKGSGIDKGVGLNLQRYSLYSSFTDCIISDLTNSPFRTDRSTRWIDGIICDPPYGVREGLKVLGKRTVSPVRTGDEEKATRRATTTGPFFVDGIPAHTLPGFIAPKRPYSFKRMLRDILDFAARSLVDGGRLAFWMPSANEAEDEFAIPSHNLLKLVHECVQAFNKWSRKLLVYERISSELLMNVSRDTHEDIHAISDPGRRADELNPFRRRYFQGFVENGRS